MQLIKPALFLVGVLLACLGFIFVWRQYDKHCRYWDGWRRADVAGRRRDYRAEAEAWRDALRAYPNDANTAVNLGFALQRSGATNEAKEIFRSVAPVNSTARKMLGKIERNSHWAQRAGRASAPSPAPPRVAP